MRGRGGRRKGRGGGFRRRKFCRFCVDKVEYIDYKNVQGLQKYIVERSKMLPRRVSGNCAKHQRMLQRAIKRARHLALVPFTSD